MYFIADKGDADCTARVSRTKYYAVSPFKLMHLLEAAGFVEVSRFDDRYYQPVIVGKRVV
jgi:hypothetical protein